MVPTYNINEMEETFENAASVALTEIRKQFETFFRELPNSGLSTDALSESDHVKVYNLSDYTSVNSIYSQQGFYVICTNHQIEGNTCTFFVDKDLRAIYRGECSSVRRRIESHLFNKQYNGSYESRKSEKLSSGGKFSEPFYGACLKIVPEISGINIDDDYYSGFKWVVAVFKMAGSTSQIRKQAELAFDSVWKRPVASRE